MTDTPAVSSSAPSSAPVEKTKHTLHLTRAALYLLEGVLQDPGPADTMPKTVLWAKVWNKIRKSNDRMLKLPWGDVDCEKPAIRNDGENDIAWTKRQQEWSTATELWRDEPVDLVLSDKYRDVCRDALKWIYEHRDDPKARTRLDNSTHASLLLTELKLADAVVDEE